MIDGRSDVWAAGIVLFRLLTRTLPYKGTLAQPVSWQILFAAPPALNPNMPLASQLNGILNLALCKDRKGRYQDAGKLAAALRALKPEADALFRCATGNLVSTRLIYDSSTTLDNQPTADARGGAWSSKATARTSPQTAQNLTGVSTERPYGIPLTYSPPELGFRSPLVGPTWVRSGRYRWRGVRDRIVKYQGHALISAGLLNALAFTVLYGNPISIVAGWGSSPEVPSFDKFLIFFAPWIVVGLLGILHTTAGLIEKTEGHPRCDGCRSILFLRSRWDRHLMTEPELRLGMTDCRNALTLGAWEEAAKLSSIYGAKHGELFGSGFYSNSLRYTLEFFECNVCGQHVARLTQGRLVNEKWVPRADYTDVFRGIRGKHVSLYARLVAIPGGVLAVWSDPEKGLGVTRIRVPILTFAVFLVIAAIYIEVPKLVMRLFPDIPDQGHAATVHDPAPVSDCVRLRLEGDAFVQGRGRPVDHRHAAAMYTEALRCGDLESANNLGEMYEHGVGIPQDIHKAFLSYQTAASRGYGPSEFNLARMYEEGVGTARNIKLAVAWYDRAASAGVPKAKDQADRLRFGTR